MAQRESLAYLAPSILKGKVTLPPSKSHTLRAIVFAAMASGTSEIQNYLHSPDTMAMIEACQKLGASIEVQPDRLFVRGGLKKQKEVYLDAQNSGQVLRFIGAVSAHVEGKVTITGDESLQKRRPCLPLVEGLKQLGAKAFCTNGHAPIIIQGPLTAGKVVIDGQDSQPVSALMIACSLLEGKTEIHVLQAGEKPWLRLTLDWLKRMGVAFDELPHDCYRIYGKKELAPFCYKVPGDLSALAFPLAMALLTESELEIENVPLNDVQGDKVLIQILEQMGAKFGYLNEGLSVTGPQLLTGCDIDVNDCIDALPILAVIGARSQGRTRLFNGAIARKKESDRIACITTELRKMGATIVEHECGLTVDNSPLFGAELVAYDDHRLAMALSVAAICASGKSLLSGIACVKKSYPHFFSELKRLGGQVS